MTYQISHTNAYYQIAEAGNESAWVVDSSGDEVVDNNGALVVADTGTTRRRYSVSHTAAYYNVTEATYGSELVTNGNFSSATGWTAFRATISGGLANFTGGSAYVAQSISTAENSTYLVTVDVKSYTSGSLFVTVGGTQKNLNVTEVGHYQTLVVAGATDTFNLITFAGFVGTVDNVSLKLVS